MKGVTIIPNPNKGTFTLQGSLQGIASKEVNLEVVDMLGQVVFKDVASVENGNISKTITLNDNVANGIYMVRIKADGASQVIKFTLDR